MSSFFRNLIISFAVLHFVLLSFTSTSSENLACYIGFSNLSTTTNGISEFDNAKECAQHGCQWYPSRVGKNWKSYCFAPQDYGYALKGKPRSTSFGYIVSLVKKGKASYMGNDTSPLYLLVEYQTNSRLHFKFTDDLQSLEKIPRKKSKATHPLYRVHFEKDPMFAFKIIRKSTGTVLFDTSLGGLSISPDFQQVSTKLPSRNLYGFGISPHRSFRHIFDQEPSNFPLYEWQKRESFIFGNTNCLPKSQFNGSVYYPYYTVLEEDGNAHSVYVENSAVQEVQLLPVPGMVYTSIGGNFDFYMLMGPTPEEVVQQFTATNIVGRPHMPPYFALGFQIGKYSEERKSDENWTEISFNDTINGLLDNHIPVDIVHSELLAFHSIACLGGMWKDIATPKYVKDLQKAGLHLAYAYHFVPLFISNDDDEFEETPCGPRKNRSLTQDEFWLQEGNGTIPTPRLPAILKCFKETDLPQQLWLGYFFDVMRQDRKNEYARKKFRYAKYRQLMLSEEMWFGIGKLVGHNYNIRSKDNLWSYLLDDIVKMLQYNQFGVPLVGSNIFHEESRVSDEFYLRWMQLQAFNPTVRAPAGGDFEKLPLRSEFVTRALRDVLITRYSLLPYLYYLFYQAHVNGNTVVRPLWHEFSNDSYTHPIDRQFMWGSGLMVNPVLEKGHTSVSVYLPKGRWYDYYSGAELKVRTRNVTLEAPLDRISLLIRGGTIIPTQKPVMNTKFSRKSNFTLIVALNSEGQATGQLFYDDGRSKDSIPKEKYLLVEYMVKNNSLQALVTKDGYKEDSIVLYVKSIRLLGAMMIWPNDMETINVNGKVYENWKMIDNSIAKSTKEIFISKLQIPINSNFTISWSTNHADRSIVTK